MTERAKANRMLLGFFVVFLKGVFFFGNSCKVIVYKMISGYMHVPVNFHCPNSDVINFIFAPVRWMLMNFVGRPGFISVLYNEVASASSLACNSIFDVFLNWLFEDVFNAVCCKEIVLILNMFQFLNVPRQTFFFWVRKTCPQISSNFTDFAKISNTPFVSFGCFRKKKGTNYTTNLRTSKALTFDRKNPSRKTAQGQCWEWSLRAGEAGDLPGTSGEFVNSLKLRFREEIIEVLTRKQQMGWVTIGV